MSLTIAEIGSEYRPSTTPRSHRLQQAGRAGIRSLGTPLFHLRALLRLGRRRQSVALGIAIVAGTALGSAGAGATLAASHLVQRMEMQAAVTPLAPAPAPPTPPALPKRPRHRLLESLRGNPLRGLASWYGSVWNGRKTASGETFDDSQMTAAHKSLPLGTLVRVTNLNSMRSVVVRINDRGTLAPNRVIDLSSAAAREIGMMEKGLARVKLEVLGRS